MTPPDAAARFSLTWGHAAGHWRAERASERDGMGAASPLTLVMALLLLGETGERVTSSVSPHILPTLQTAGKAPPGTAGPGCSPSLRGPSSLSARHLMAGVRPELCALPRVGMKGFHARAWQGQAMAACIPPARCLWVAARGGHGPLGSPVAVPCWHNLPKAPPQPGHIG